ncbi:bifunctional folylpolyglutamate synthase/dihydrofolate synthase [Terricaulis sp.]|uniref:bifunctional folylpolyglutamate synthase/dihydrofolate synthase n=1 Tax=Terricaulis sp. TaxID=2768686 RepID=UPI0037846D75
MRRWVVPYPKFGDGPGLARVAKIAAVLQLDLPAFGANGAVVVGSNGKGSTAAMTAALLRETGRSVGLFTSPHLFALNERFRIDDDDIDDDALDHHWRRVAAAAGAAGEDARLGGFEFLFLIAADWFAARGAAHTVWEAGIGGRLDPVKLVEARRVGLAALDLEHTELLGATLAEIARDKIDAAPEGARLYAGASCASERGAIETHAAQRKLSVTFTGEHDAPLPGRFQRENAALAVALARDIAPMDEARIAAGLARVRWPGRLEVLDEAPLTVIDVGHTPAGVAAALQGFRALAGDRRAVLVCGVSRDKDAGAIVGALAPAFATVIAAQALHKGAPAAEIAALASAANPHAEIVVAESVADARQLALARAKAAGQVVYAAGGLFLASEFRCLHKGFDPAALAFF